MSIADKLNKLLSTKSKIKTSIESKGVTVGDIPFGEYSQKIDSISSGGGSTIVPKTITQNGVYNATDEGVDGYNPVTIDFGAEIDPSIPTVTYVDYDGRVIMQVKTKDFVAPPPNPIKEGCIFDEWTEDLTAITLNPYMDYTIGAHYTTDDDTTRIYIELTPSDGKIYSSMFYVFSGVQLSIDWGDNSTPFLINKGNEGNYPASHTYADYGTYVIKVTATGSTTIPDRQWGLYNNNQYSGSFGGSSVHVRKVELGRGAILTSCAFASCTNLESITTPSRPLANGNDSHRWMFFNCIKLKACFIKWNNLGFQDIFSGCTNLKWLVLQIQTSTSLYMTSFEYCVKLEKLILDNATFGSASANLPPLPAIKVLILPQQTIMKMTAPMAFGTSNRDMVIYVPDSLVQTYKTATNWVTYAKYIYPLSSRPLD